MKICQIVPSLEARHGGPSRSVRALSAALARGGHEVEILTTSPEGADEYSEGRLRVRVFRRDWPPRFCPSSGLRQALRGNDADLIHHHSLWLRTLHYAHQGSRKSGACFVLSPRGMMSPWSWHHRKWRKAFARQVVHPGALTGAAGWHATSSEEAADISSLGFDQPVCVAPNGVDAPDVSAVSAAVSHWEAACPEVTKQPVALFYSRFHQKKRVIELIDLWLEHGPRDWLLLVVGIPEEYTQKMIEDYVLRSSGNGRVRVFSGSERPPPYAVASLFLLPSHSENFGLVVAEAMAHGVPVIVTDSTPWRSLHSDQLGWCVPWRDFGAAILTAACEGVDRLRQRGRNSREWVLREFSWDKSAAILAQFYQSLRATGR